jgi:hypothetical protein
MRDGTDRLEQRDKPSTEGPSAEALRLGHEPTAINLRAIGWSIGILFAIAGVTYVIVWVVMVGIERSQTRDDPPQSRLARSAEQAKPPQPWLQPSPAQQHGPRQPFQDMRAFLEHEDRILTSYGSTDAQTGTAQVPIHRAMEIFVEQQRAAAKPARPTTQWQ